jgi:peptide/nickel transport system permease protein
MQRYIVIRILQALLTLSTMTVVVFSMARLTGSPLDVMLDEYATLEDRARLARHLGLDQPVWVQYGVFLSNLLTGDLGDSLRNRRPVLQLIQERFLASVQLGLVAFAFCTVTAIPLGIYTAIRKDTFVDNIGKIIAMLGQSLPSFWLGIMLIMIFAVQLGLLPSSGRAGPQSYVLPVLTLGWHAVAGLLRLTRSAMLDVLDNEYVKLARIKGLSERTVVLKHCLKNALIPIVTFSGLIFVHLLSGSIVSETVFGWPGLGSLAIESVRFRDYPVTQGVVLFFTTLFLTVNLMVDLLYAYLDPTIRY